MDTNETAELPEKKNFTAHLMAGMGIAAGQCAIRESRLSLEVSKITGWEADSVVRVRRMENGWENDPDAIAEVFNLIGGEPLAREVIDIFCLLWRGGFRTSNLSKPV